MFWKKHHSLIIVIFLALLFFIGTASFNYYSQGQGYSKWSSPDETANYFFTKQFSQNHHLFYFDEANLKSNGLVIPRSMRSDSGFIKPVSFLGIILIYGTIASIFGVAVIPYLTPLFAAVAIIIFYLFLRKLFSERVAFYSSFILTFFPVYIYYTVRSMFHNVLFIVLLLVGFYILSFIRDKNKEKNKLSLANLCSFSLSKIALKEILLSFFGGMFIGLASITRTSELIWLLPALLLIYIFYFRRFTFLNIISFISGFILAFIPVAYYNQILYGSFWHSGYRAMNSSLVKIAQSSSALWQFTWQGHFNYYRQSLEAIFKQIFYFGFNYQQSLQMFWHYVVLMFSALSIAGALGLFVLLGQNIKHRKKKQIIYILIWLLISIILVFYYGSWKFNDNPALNHFTIGNSYTRYWLPIYLGLIPLAALAIVRFTQALVFSFLENKSFLTKNLLIWGQAIIILIYIYISLNFVIFGSEEGLLRLYQNSKIERKNTQQVWSLTEARSIIITRYNDKFFWPERRVIVGTLPGQEILKEGEKLVKFYPLYYYNFSLREKDLDYLNRRKLNIYHLKIELVKKIDKHFSLYRIKQAESYEKK